MNLLPFHLENLSGLASHCRHDEYFSPTGGERDLATVRRPARERVDFVAAGSVDRRIAGEVRDPDVDVATSIGLKHDLASVGRPRRIVLRAHRRSYLKGLANRKRVAFGAVRK